MRWWALLRSARLGMLLRDGKLALRLLRDPRVPIWQKALPLAALLYVLSPIDLAPDFIPVLGQLDDLAVILAAIEGLIRAAPPHVVDEHRAALARRIRTPR